MVPTGLARLDSRCSLNNAGTTRVPVDLMQAPMSNGACSMKGLLASQSRESSSSC